MSFTLQIEEWILLIAFLLIYAIFLFYDIFKRAGEEKYGTYAYILATLPANYLWFVAVKNDNIGFGYAGAMSVLVGLWILLVLRDIFIKDKEKGIKDADDVALMLFFSILINTIASAVIPEIPEDELMTRGTSSFWNYFYMPELAEGAPDVADNLVLLSYRILVTILIFMVLIPILIDLKGTKTNIIALLILTGIFMLPLWFIVFIWIPEATGSMFAVSMFLGAIIFFMIMLAITKGQADSDY